MPFLGVKLIWRAPEWIAAPPASYLGQGESATRSLMKRSTAGTY